MSTAPTPGEKIRAALAAEKPLQIAGAINAYAALLAQRAGFRALYLSGAGVANHSYGIPDVGDTTLADVLIDVRRITGRVDLPLLVDIDTGWDDPAAAVRAMAAAGAAAVHIEDRVPAKLCGHLPGKQANLTEFGQTPFFTLEELRAAGIALALYPLSASRAAAAASLDVYAAIRRDGTQQSVVGRMQTRKELYDILGYQQTT